MNQKEIAHHIDLSQPAVSGLMEKLGIDWKSSDLETIRIAYIRHLREQAAGRAAAGDIDLPTERALLAKEQRVRIEMQNAVTRKELAPVDLIEEVLAKAGSRAARILDTIPGLVRRRAPDLNADILDAIQAEVAKARNIAAAVSLADLEKEELSADDDASPSSDSCTESEDDA